MKAYIIAAAALGLAFSHAQAASAEVPMCLVAHMVDHTHVVNPSRVQFVMKDGKVWQNDLHAACNGLNFHGFEILGHQDELCGGQGISVIETHEVCQLGNFTAYVPPPKTPAGQ